MATPQRITLKPGSNHPPTFAQQLEMQQGLGLIPEVVANDLAKFQLQDLDTGALYSSAGGAPEKFLGYDNATSAVHVDSADAHDGSGTVMNTSLFLLKSTLENGRVWYELEADTDQENSASDAHRLIYDGTRWIIRDGTYHAPTAGAIIYQAADGNESYPWEADWTDSHTTAGGGAPALGSNGVRRATHHVHWQELTGTITKFYNDVDKFKWDTPHGQVEILNEAGRVERFIGGWTDETSDVFVDSADLANMRNGVSIMHDQTFIKGDNLINAKPTWGSILSVTGETIAGAGNARIEYSGTAWIVSNGSTQYEAVAGNEDYPWEADWTDAHTRAGNGAAALGGEGIIRTSGRSNWDDVVSSYYLSVINYVDFLGSISVNGVTVNPSTTTVIGWVKANTPIPLINNSLSIGAGYLEDMRIRTIDNGALMTSPQDRDSLLQCPIQSDYANGLQINGGKGFFWIPNIGRARSLTMYAS